MKSLWSWMQRAVSLRPDLTALTMAQVKRTSTGVYELISATESDGSQSESASFTLAVKVWHAPMPLSQTQPSAAYLAAGA